VRVASAERACVGAALLLRQGSTGHTLGAAGGIEAVITALAIKKAGRSLSPYQRPYRSRHPVDFSRPLLTLPLLLPLPWRGVPGRRVPTRGPRAEPCGMSRVLPRDHARRGRAWFRRPSTSRRRTPNATSTTRSRRAARHAPSPRPAGVRFWLQTARSAVGRARFRKRTLQHRTYTSDTCSPFMIVIKSVFRSGFVTPRGDHGRDR
jgi:hypothetical protein